MQVLPEAALRTTLEDGDLRAGIPGKQLAERIAEGLRARGITCGDVYRDEPFWSFPVPTAIRQVHISVYLYRPDEVREKAIWGVSLFRPARSLLRRLSSRPDDSDLPLILEALHSLLSIDKAIWDVRWFKELPAEPYADDSYAHYPVIAL